MYSIEKFLKDSYPYLTQPQILKNINGGSRSKNFLIKDRNQYFFLKNYYLSQKDVLQIHKIQNFFFEKGIPVICPVLNNKNKSISIFNDQIYTLFPFINGYTIPKEKLSKENLASLAKMLALIHLAGKNPPDFSMQMNDTLWNSEKSFIEMNDIENKVNSIKEKNEYDLLVLKFLDLKREILKSNKIKYKDLSLKNDHLIHGDYYEKNVFFDKDGKVSYVFDWEQTKLLSRALEIVRSIEIICFSGIYNEITKEKAKFFLNSYNNVYPIDREEIVEALKVFVLIRAHSLRIEKLHYQNQIFISDPLLINDFRFLEYNYYNGKELIDSIYE